MDEEHVTGFCAWIAFSPKREEFQRLERLLSATEARLLSQSICFILKKTKTKQEQWCTPVILVPRRKTRGTLSLIGQAV